MSTFVIGDIHGGLKALTEVLKVADITTNDTLIFLGDYVDGWSQSADVIEYLIKLQENHTCIFIRGNHDNWCQEWLKTGVGNAEWLFHGGKLTVDSYENEGDYNKIEHLRFFEQMKNYHIDDQNRLFVHAGFSSMHGVQKEHHESNYYWDRTLWEMALVVKESSLEKDTLFYPKRLKHYNEIYIGHTPTTNYQIEEPIQAANIHNIDTGAGFKGKLTIMNINTKEYWQSTPVYQLYPNEKGRN